jgi:hypothetical protein
VNASGSWSANVTGVRQIALYHNTTLKNVQSYVTNATASTSFNYFTIAQLAANDTVTIRGYQTSGGNLNISSSTAGGIFAIFKLC